jgi:hypothetical protein
MKMLRSLFAIALICGLANVAKADDFQMVVVDPTVPVDLIQPVFSDDFALTFPTTGPAAGCEPSQLPGVSLAGDAYTACFTGINLTGKPLTSLEIEMPVFDYPGTTTPDTPSCPTETLDAFSDVTCGLTNGGADYLLEFSGGDIPTATLFNSFCYFDPIGGGGVDCSSPAIFTIAIGIPGIDLITEGTVVDTINSDDITVKADATLTPEPSSILLLSTGVLSIGLLGAHRRRRNLVAAFPPAAANLN